MSNLDFLIELAFKEDLPNGDITTDTLIDDETSTAILTAKEDMVVCGLHISSKIFTYLDRLIKVENLKKDGDFIQKNENIQKIYGSTKSILKAERIALNFIQRLSGIATTTYKYQKIAAPYGVKILDTRKTTPGFRALEKMAVKVGGGTNHRFNLSQTVMIKDNHIKAQGSIENAIIKARNNVSADISIEVETKTINEVKSALKAKPDIIMLDNMTPKMVLIAKEIIGKKAKIEVSGGINLETIEDYAKTGVDFISVGALTHSYKSMDISLNIT